jgi:hypothetical protein
MMKRFILPVSLLIGITFDLLFWEKAPGISFPIFVLLCTLSGFWLINVSGKQPAKVNYLLVIAAILFSLMTFVRREPFTSFLGFSITLLSMALLAASYTSGRWIKFNLVEHIASFFHLAGGMIALPWTQKSDNQENESGDDKKRRLAPILRGIALSVPIWLIFISLLYSADLIFASRIDSLLLNLRLENLADLIIQLIFALIIAYFFAGAILFAAQRSDRSTAEGEGKPVVTPFLGLTETSIILGGVIVLFASFVGIQFQYFFSGQANITLKGFTYAEYARRGFGELVGVASLSVLLLKGLSVATKKESMAKRRIFSGLSAGLVALVLVMLVSAFQRLSLYESAYGFTRLRTYSHIFMIWLAIYMLAYLGMEFLHRQNQFINFTLLAMAGFPLTLGLLGVDPFIVRKNIDRSIQGEAFDAGYLAGLSSDAVPVMAEFYSGRDLPADLRDGLGAALVCFQQTRVDEPLDERPWQSFHLADHAALNALESVSRELKLYEINAEEWPMVVTSPRGLSFPCQGFLEWD